MLLDKQRQLSTAAQGNDNINNFGDDVIYARAFPCTIDDLNIYFVTDNRPLLITQMLCSCLKRQDGDQLNAADVWAWSLSQRLQALLIIAQASLPSALMFTTKCSHDDCRETLELPMDLNLFRSDDQCNVVMCQPEEAIEVEIRSPTGNDQQHWLNHAGDDVEQAMAKRLITRINGQTPASDWQLPTHWLPSIAQSLEDKDPFTVMILQSECPACYRVSDVAFDLEEYLLRQLEQQQWRLKQQVHQLASFYHWSESEIVALPNNRREEYLHLIHEAMQS